LSPSFESAGRNNPLSTPPLHRTWSP